ncbi:hypothetical protein ACWGIP_21345, partial [Streptomyces sp. NPDC054838]
MSPGPTNRSCLGPLPQRGSRLKGGVVASLALLLTGIASPAIAMAPNAATTTADIRLSGPMNGGDEDHCQGRPPHHHDGRPEDGSGQEEGHGQARLGQPGAEKVVPGQQAAKKAAHGDLCEGPTGPTGPPGPTGDTG